jgi:hypothetical protein
MKTKILASACALAACLFSGCQHNYQFNVPPARSNASVSPATPAAGQKVANAPDADPASCCVDPNSAGQKKS